MQRVFVSKALQDWKVSYKIFVFRSQTVVLSEATTLRFPCTFIVKKGKAFTRTYTHTLQYGWPQRNRLQALIFFVLLILEKITITDKQVDGEGMLC